MSELQISRARERTMVRVADTALRLLPRATGRHLLPEAVRRVLLLRLERIGDLLMVLEAIADARAAWPAAEIDLAVGAWNAELATLIPGVHQVHTLSVPWLARQEVSESWPALIAKARRWRERDYDIVVNFEPDIRTNLLAWLSGGRTRVGYFSGGGGGFLTDATSYTSTSHVSLNARRLIARASGVAVPGEGEAHSGRRLQLPADIVRFAVDVLRGVARPLIGLHVSGGRASKQWHLDRFGVVARELASATGGSIVLTGTSSDLPMVTAVERQLEGLCVLNLAGNRSLIEVAALVAQLDLLVTSDTGPMHLAGAVGAPVVALFGPSDPARYGPVGSPSRVLRVSLPCSPCGQVRLPPQRCRGHVPDCMHGITVSAVTDAAMELLQQRRRAPREEPLL